jgi:hypothetical protein
MARGDAKSGDRSGADPRFANSPLSVTQRFASAFTLSGFRYVA